MPKGENRPSILLSREENEQVFSLIGPKCQSLATAVVQLFTTEGPAHSEWKKRDTGVLCLVKDNGKRSYFFRIYCLYRRAMIWEHEVYLQIEYKNPRPYLHTFEAEEYMTAFNFANEGEAHVLQNILVDKINLRKIRREERRQRALTATRASNSSSLSNSSTASKQNGVLPPPPAPELEPAPVLPPKSTLPGTYTLKSSGKKLKTRKLTKADIGTPHDFKHISHVGWDAHKGFDVETTQPNEELVSFFNMAGVSEIQLQDDETREFIYSFIEKNGGIDAVKEDLHTSNSKPVRSASRTGPPPAPTTSPPAPPALAYTPAPPSTPAPPVPQRNPAPTHPPAPPSRAPPPPPSRAVPPPPPVSAPKNPPPPRPLLPPSAAPPSVPPPPPPGVAPPPPPPPPPPAPPAAPAAPPPPPMPTDSAGGMDAPGGMDPRFALMESIRSGSQTLKRVEVTKSPTIEPDSRSNLLSEIRQGIGLKSVSRSDGDSNSISERKAAPPACGLAGALARALQERSRAIHSDSDDDDDDDDNTSDGEWDE